MESALLVISDDRTGSRSGLTVEQCIGATDQVREAILDAAYD